MIVRTEAELDFVLGKLEKVQRYCLDTETVDRGDLDISLTGISVGWSLTEGAYIPVGHRDGLQLPKDLVMERFRRFVATSQEKLVVFHNAKYDMKVLKLNGGIEFGPMIFCTMVASWLLDTENEHGLKALSKRYLNQTMTELSEFCPKEKHPVHGGVVYRTDMTPIDVMGRYAVSDATKPIALMDVFLPRLVDDGLLKVFSELEMPKQFILMDVEIEGIQLDIEMLEQRLQEAPKVLAEIEQRMYALRPNKKQFNANSPKQLNEILFGELKIKPIGEPGKSGMYSTDKECMEQWEGKYPLVGAILEYKAVSRLLGTYLEGLKKRVGPDGRVRTRFNPILTTGRLSSSEPNLQNIPKKDKDQFGLRDMFIAKKGTQLVVADYSQIELRVLAHISRDPVFIRAFMDGEDLHSYAAQVLFDLEGTLKEIKENHAVERSIGKTFNFAMVYEAGVKRLASSAKVNEARAKELRDKYMARFRGIENYIDTMHSKAEAQGYVTTLIGRRRHLPNAKLKGKDPRSKELKSSALRQSSNTPVQGSAADILFIGMRNIRYRLIEEGLLEKVRLVLQVHDEVIYEVDNDVTEYASQLIKQELESAVKLNVPIIADTEVGYRWSDCK